jgi:hypothetical protein
VGYTTATSAERPDPGGTDSLMRKQSAAPVRLQSGARHGRIVREQRRRPAVAVNIPPTGVNSQCLPYPIIRMGFGKGPPDHRAIEPPEFGKVVVLPRLGGLHHRYSRRAA